MRVCYDFLNLVINLSTRAHGFHFRFYTLPVRSVKVLREITKDVILKLKRLIKSTKMLNY